MYRSLFALAAGTGARAGELFALRVESDVDLDEHTITIRRSVFEGEENTSKSDSGYQDRTGTVPIDSSVVLELKNHLKGRRSGYLCQTRNGRHAVAAIQCAGGQASVNLERDEANPTWRRNACFSKRADFSTRVFRSEPSGHSRLVRTLFGQDGRPLHQAVAPAPRP